MQWIMHDWSDESCVKILKNCRKAILKETGKVIIIDVVLEPEGNGLFDDTSLVFDLVMIAHTKGKERTELEWKKVLEGAGFSRYNIIKIPALQSIIEAYPKWYGYDVVLFIYLIMSAVFNSGIGEKVW